MTLSAKTIIAIARSAAMPVAATKSTANESLAVDDGPNGSLDGTTVIAKVASMYAGATFIVA